MKTTFLVKSWRNCSRRFTPAELLERITADSASNYGWYAPASYLVEVINHPDFPVYEASEIKILILDCFSSLMQGGDVARGHQLSTDGRAIQECFNTLSDFYPRARATKERFLQSIIVSVRRQFYDDNSINVIFSPEVAAIVPFQQFLDSWCESVKESYQGFINKKGSINLWEWENWLRHSIRYRYRVYRQSKQKEWDDRLPQNFHYDLKDTIKIVNDF